ncbi:hypothetical protein DKM19_13660 [Streptosporangium sp. 'caverna']|nr:hypothetical protein DKM19_13660 [Streptosporangium sp. 'caverna']
MITRVDVQLMIVGLALAQSFFTGSRRQRSAPPQAALRLPISRAAALAAGPGWQQLRPPSTRRSTLGSIYSFVLSFRSIAMTL